MTEREAARKARNAYAKAYREKHPERIKAAQERYWARKAQQVKKEVQTDEK